MRVGIVGAGILGQLMALRFITAGHHVTLFEQHTTLSNCSMVAAGLLTPTSELDKSQTLIYTLGRASLTQHWPRILKELDCPIYFQQIGSLVVHHPQDAAEWNHFKTRIQAQIKNPPCQLIEKAALEALEPELQAFQHAYYFPEEGQIDTQNLLTALERHLTEVGVIWKKGVPIQKIHDLQSTNDYVIDCRGLGAKALFPTLRGVRGEIIHLHAPQVRLSRPIRLLHPRYSIYIVPRPNHHYLIGATEIETEEDSPISVRSTLELLSAAYSVHRGFDEARIIKTATQLRPTLPDHLPRMIKKDKVIAVNGLYRHGYLIAPALVEEVYHYAMESQYDHHCLLE